MKLATRSRSLPEMLHTLRTIAPSPTGVLSVYLDTSPERALGQAYLLKLKDLCQQSRPSIPISETTAFEAARERVETYLTNGLSPLHAGEAIFAGQDEAYFFAVPLPRAPREHLFWGPRPHIAELQAEVDEFERIGIMLLDKERARLLTVYMGEIEDRLSFEDDVPGKQATGDWFALSQKRYERHHEDHVLRHLRRATDSMLVMLHARPFSRLFIGGPDEALAMLTSHLPETLRSRLAGTLSVELFASDAEVLQTALAVAAQVERRVEESAVADLLEASPSRYTTRGLAETLAALSERRVHTLFIAETFASQGVECTACHRLLPITALCPVCGAEVTRVDDLQEAMVERALDQGARVETVVDDAASQLSLVGGLAAWTRY